MGETKISPETIKLAGDMLRREHTERVRLEKEAEASALEKRAHKIAFREVELGLAEPFKSLEEFQQKIAGLIEDGDLEIVEKALERGYHGSRKTGDLVGTTPSKSKNALEQYVLTGEFEENV